MMRPVDLICEWCVSRGYGVERQPQWSEVWVFVPGGRSKAVSLHVFRNLDVFVGLSVPVTLSLNDPGFFEELGERLEYEWCFLDDEGGVIPDSKGNPGPWRRLVRED